MIDIHTHLGRVRREDTWLTEELMVRQLDKLGIEQAVILPLCGAPEGLFFSYTNEQALEAYRKFPDRFIPFCNLDPRHGGNRADTDFSWILKEYKDKGCRGVGELTCGLYFDDPRTLNLMGQCGRAGLPVVFHLAAAFEGQYGLVDDIHLPRMEKVLQALPDTVFFGHGHAFWAEIAAELDEAHRGYNKPSGPIAKPGRVPELLAKYPNLYGDLSAGSAYNALTRDPGFGPKFLEKFQDKLLFGTDLLREHQDCPIVGYLNSLHASAHITEAAFLKITRWNAARVLQL